MEACPGCSASCYNPHAAATLVMHRVSHTRHSVTVKGDKGKSSARAPSEGGLGGPRGGGRSLGLSFSLASLLAAPSGCRQSGPTGHGAAGQHTSRSTSLERRWVARLWGHRRFRNGAVRRRFRNGAVRRRFRNGAARRRFRNGAADIASGTH